MATNIRGGDDAGDDDVEGALDDLVGLGQLGTAAVGPDGAVDLDLVKRRLKQVLPGPSGSFWVLLWPLGP
jgi:hypothetical protein